MTEELQQPIALIAITVEEVQAFALQEMMQDISETKAQQVVNRLKSTLQKEVAFRAMIKNSIEAIDLESQYADWFEQVDDAVWRMAGLSAHDLPDIDYYNLFVVDTSPALAAKKALTNAGFEHFT